jgi:hypothetical protein
VADRPFPYTRCQTVRYRGLTTTSGKPLQISPNAALQQQVAVVAEEGMTG